MLFGDLKHRRAPSVASLPSSPPVPNLTPRPEDLDHELFFLSLRYGQETLIAALEKMKKRRRGPRRNDDGALLEDHFLRDAKDLLKGTPLRSDYKLVKEFTDAVPAHERESTTRRLLKKIKDIRPLEVRWKVSQIGESDYPHTAFLAALDAPLFGETTNPYLDVRKEEAVRIVAEYSEKIGLPPDNMSVVELKEAVAHWVPPQPLGITSGAPLAASGLLDLLTGASGNSDPTS